MEFGTPQGVVLRRLARLEASVRIASPVLTTERWYPALGDLTLARIRRDETGARIIANLESLASALENRGR
jgi:hypothetical protein